MTFLTVYITYSVFWGLDGEFHSAGEVPGMICHLVQYIVFEISRHRVNQFAICLKILLGH